MKQHYDYKPRRRAEYITPPNKIKKKVGSGGLSEEILNKAQMLLETNAVDFIPLAQAYLEQLQEGIDIASEPFHENNTEYVISTMLYPAMQLKANGGMFHYPLVTKIADRVIQFLEVIETPDPEVVAIIQSFHKTVALVVREKIQGDGGERAKALMMNLENACQSYLNRYAAQHPKF